jgi:hypothetical protein
LSAVGHFFCAWHRHKNIIKQVVVQAAENHILHCGYITS